MFFVPFKMPPLHLPFAKCFQNTFENITLFQLLCPSPLCAIVLPFSPIVHRITHNTI